MAESEINTDAIQTARILTKIETLEKQREEFLTQANQQNAALAGAIQALRDLLSPEPEPSPESEVPDESASSQPVVEAITA